MKDNKESEPTKEETDSEGSQVLEKNNLKVNQELGIGKKEEQGKTVMEGGMGEEGGKKSMQIKILCSDGENLVDRERGEKEGEC